MGERVVCRVEAGVADVRLNRADKVNALDAAMFDALIETGEHLKADPSVRAVVLSGEGRGFCAGLDFGAFQSMASGRQPDGASGRPAVDLGSRDGRITNRGQQAAWVWQEVPAPVIAAVHGVALGGGLQIALGADLRIVAPDARLSVLEIKWGLVPDMTGTQMLVRLVGLDVAKDLTFTGRMVSGEEAVGLGLATRCSDDPRGDALAVAADLAARSPHALRAAKRLLNQAGLVDLATGFAAEAQEISALIGSPNQVEAVTAVFEDRPPSFADPD